MRRAPQCLNLPVVLVGEQQPLLNADSSALRAARQCAPSPFTISSHVSSSASLFGAICVEPVLDLFLCRCSGHWGGSQISVSGCVCTVPLHTDRRQSIKIKIFNIASKQSGRLLWKQRCHGNGDWGGYRGNDRRHGDCITVGYIRGIRKETRSIFDHCLCAQSSVFLRCTCVLHR